MTQRLHAMSSWGIIRLRRLEQIGLSLPSAQMKTDARAAAVAQPSYMPVAYANHIPGSRAPQNVAKGPPSLPKAGTLR